MNVQQRLYNLVLKLSENDNAVITEKTNLIDDLSFDSVLMVSMIVEIESEFGITLDDDDLELDILSNVGQLIKLINKKVSEGKNEYWYFG